jgi:hypothetical protein
MHTLFVNDLIQLHCLQRVSNIQVFILRKTCTCTFMVFYHAEIIMKLYELSRYNIFKSAYRWFFLHVRQNKSRPKTGYVIYHHTLQHAAATTFLIIKVFYSPTDAQVSCLKYIIKIDIKTAPTCFSAVTPSSGSALFVLAEVTVVKIVL